MIKAKHIGAAIALVIAMTGVAQGQSADAARPLAAPKDVVVQPGDRTAILKWAAVAGADGYRIYLRGPRETTATFIGSVTETEFVAVGLDNGFNYELHVAAIGHGEPGTFSAAVRVVPVEATPTAVPSEPAATAAPAPAAPQMAVVGRVPIIERPLPPPDVPVMAPATSATEAPVTALPTVVAEATAPPPVVDTATLPAPMAEPPSHVTPPAAVEVPAPVVQPAAVEGPAPVVQPAPEGTAPAPALAVPGGTVLTAVPGNKLVNLTWSAVPDATSYRVFRSTTGTFSSTPLTTTTATTMTDKAVTNDTTYFYTVVVRNASGDGPQAPPVTATPVAPPTTPTGLAATAGNRQVSMTWVAVSGATSYSVYRGTASNQQAVLTQGLATPAFLDESVENGPRYFYKVTAVNAGGESSRSSEVTADPTGPPAGQNAAIQAAHRLLRQATWGPRPGDVAAVRAMGAAAFIDAQLAADPSQYPDILLTLGTDVLQSHFVNLALTGEDQLRQRVAWALHKIWVVSGVEVNNSSALVNYHRILLNNAFGNYRDLMERVTLSPAMGRYLNMLNSRGAHVTGAPANENYPRELMQLFTLGIPTLRPDGVPFVDDGSKEIPAYNESDVKELARILSGWTFGDGNPATVPTRAGSENYRVPMEPVAAYHDTTAKNFLGMAFAADQSARADLTQALDLIFGHPNLGPFVARQLIQQLVTSNPSPGYVWAIAQVFDDNGQGVRGDLAAVVKAILLHPLAAQDGPDPGKLAEPLLFAVSQLRAVNASVTDSRFIVEWVANMGQRVLFPPSVFSYFSPGFRVRAAIGADGRPLAGPEFQGLTTVTAQTRINFVAAVVAGWFASSMTADYAPFEARTADPAVLVDYCSEVFMGTRMPLEMRNEIVAAVRVASASSPLERIRTAIYLTVTAALQQVE